MDDSVVTTFSLRGIRDLPTDRKTADLLMLRYHAGHWQVLVTANREYLGPQAPSVMLRWDAAKPVTETWTAEPDFAGALCPRPVAFIERATESTRLVVRLFPKLIGESTVVFDLTGLREEFDKHPELLGALEENDTEGNGARRNRVTNLTRQGEHPPPTLPK